MSERDEIQRARIIVVAAIETTPTCYRPDISRHAAGRVSEDAIRAAISELCREGVIRMNYEHDWEYLLNASLNSEEGCGMSYKRRFFDEMMQELYPNAGLIRLWWEWLIYQFTYAMHKDAIDVLLNKSEEG